LLLFGVILTDVKFFFKLERSIRVMKKTLSTVALSTVLVLGMAASAFALHETQASQTAVSAAGAANLTIDGSIRQRGLIQKSDAVKDSASRSNYDGRVRLGVKAQVGDQVTGYVQLETGSGTGDSYDWGTGSATGINDGGFKTGGSLTVLQSWIQYVTPVAGVKVGHMPLALGNKVFFDHTGEGDDAIMVFKNTDDTELAGMMIKFDEQDNTISTDDLDGYVFMATHKFSDNLDAGVNWTYVLGGSAGSGELAEGMSFSNVGMNANYRQDNLSFLADVEMQFGDVYDDGTTAVDASGWAVKLGASIDLGTAKVGLLYGYGSGDDGTDASDNDSFVNFLSSDNYDTIIAGYRAYVPGTSMGLGNGNLTNSGLSNLSEYQINVSTKTTCPMTGKDLSLMASATYLQLNEEAQAAGEYANGGTTGPQYLGNDDSVGTELDAIATWSLAPGLTYKVEAAYLFVGDAWNTSTSGDGANPDDLYFLRHRLVFAF
jgi:hypothetical protein